MPSFSRPGDTHACDAALPSPASQLGRSRCRDRFLHPAVLQHVEDDLGRLSRAEIADRRADPVHQGRHAAADLAADRDLAFRLARASTRARASKPTRRGPTSSIGRSTPPTKAARVLISSDTWPAGAALGLTRAEIAEAKAKGVQPARERGFAYLQGPDGAIVEYLGNFPAERMNHVHMFQEHPFCAQLWYQKHLNAPVFAGPHQRDADDRSQLPGAARAGAVVAGDGTPGPLSRAARGGRVQRRGADLVRAPGRRAARLLARAAVRSHRAERRRPRCLDRKAARRRRRRSWNSPTRSATPAR